MLYRETLTLESDKPIEARLLKQLDACLHQRGIGVHMLDVEFYCLEVCRKLVIEKGPSYILSLQTLQEELLRKGRSKEARHLLVQVLINHLQRLSPSRNLTIVDRYFFPRDLHDRAHYASTFRQIFGSVVPSVATVTFITRPKYNRAVYEDIKSVLLELNPEVKVMCRETDDFHDRYWIADELKGLFVGTSFNGLGKKYALVDFIRDEDTATIVQELKRASLI